MINTFNLEQNLLTFPSERDILTGGRGGVSAMEDGWRDGRLFACPRASVRAAALPACRSQATAQVRREKSSLATQEAQQAGPWDLQLGRLALAGMSRTWKHLSHRPRGPFQEGTAGSPDPDHLCRTAGFAPAVGGLLLRRAGHSGLLGRCRLTASLFSPRKGSSKEWGQTQSRIKF